MQPWLHQPNTTMPSRPINKGRSNDHDFVPPTQYSRTKQPLPSLLSQLELIPKFEAIELENAEGSPQSRHDRFQLMAHSSSFKHASPIDRFGVRTNIRNHIITSKNGCNGTHDVISQSAKEGKACMAQGRMAQASGKRMVLQELSDNSVRINQNGEKLRRPRPPRTRYGCSACQIHLCQGGTCWEEHTQLSELK